jgi:Rrf2 family protein
VHAGLLRTIRGAHGGNRLAKQAEAISLYDIVCAMQGPMAFSPCEHDPTWCQRFGTCSVHGIWEELDAEIRSRLEKVSLAQMVKDRVKFEPTKVAR